MAHLWPLILALTLGGITSAAQAQARECRQGSDDCRSLGPAYGCLPQKTGHPRIPSPAPSIVFRCRRLPVKHVAPIVSTKDKSCAQASDCLIIWKACACKHSSCQRGDDLAQGVVDAVNLKARANYEMLAACTSAETQSCATAGACVPSGSWSAKCELGHCRPEFIRAKN